MKGLLRWVRQYGWLGLLVVLGAVLWVSRVSKRTPTDVLTLERQAIAAGEKARLRAAEVGYAFANHEIDVEHLGALTKLDKAQRRKSRDLHSDPAARARWLTRLATHGPGADG